MIGTKVEKAPGSAEMLAKRYCSESSIWKGFLPSSTAEMISEK